MLEDLGYKVTAICNTYEKAILQLNTKSFDIAMLDINLSGRDSGIDIAKYITLNLKTPFIFLTAFGDKATVKLASETRPNAYLIKPATPPSLFAAIQTALYNYQNKNVTDNDNEEESKDSFYVKTGNKVRKIDWDEVVCISAGKNYISIQTNAKNQADSLIRSSLQQALNNLIPRKYKPQFVQIYRSQCINTKHIISFTNNQVNTVSGYYEISEKFYRIIKTALEII